MTRDVDKMKKDELRRYAKELGVEIRQGGPTGKKNDWRAVDDVKKDCKTVQARLCQPPQENGPLEASAGASPSSREALLPAQNRAPNVEGGVANWLTLKQKAASVGLRQGGTKSQLEAKIKDSSSRQQTLAQFRINFWNCSSFCHE